MGGANILHWWRNIRRADKTDKQTNRRSRFKTSKRLRFDKNRNSVIVRNEKKQKWYSWIWLAVRNKNKPNCNNNNFYNKSLRDDTDKEAMANLETDASTSCEYKMLVKKISRGAYCACVLLFDL